MHSRPRIRVIPVGVQHRTRVRHNAARVETARADRYRARTDERRGGGDSVPVRIRLLGPVVVTRDGETLDAGPPARRTVLAVLAAHAGRTVPVGALIDALWPAPAPPSAAGTVYTHVSALRRMLEPGRARYAGGGVLAGTGDGYELRVTAVDVDVAEFLAARAQAARARAAGDVPGERRTLHAALQLWTGPAMAGLRSPFAVTFGRRLEEMRRAAAERLATLPAEKPVAAWRARPAAPSGRLPAEPAVLRHACEALAAGNGGSLWLEGGPGSGKTTLIRAGLLALPPGVRVGWGTGEPLLTGVALATLLECLDIATDPAYDELSRAAAGTALAGPAPDVLERASALVERLCEDGPLVLVLDDAQWADDATLLAWHSLQQLARRLPLLLVGAARPAPQRRRLTLLRDVLATAGVSVVQLPSRLLNSDGA
jgi:DNA-binding winged helix-turn-helix (wHTH) protein